MKTFKEVVECIAHFLTYIDNLCLSDVFPSELELAIPIKKKEDKDDIQNYRPISLLSNLVKFLRKLYN